VSTVARTSRSSAPARGWQWPKRALAAALPVLLLLGVADILLRSVPSRVDSIRRLIMATPDERGYQLNPDTTIHFDGLFTRLPEPVLWTINDQGLREDRRVAPRSEKFRIATHGDSETFGWSVALDDTFQRLMEARDDRLEVINFGVPGYNITNIARHVEATLPDFAPDLVLYVVNKNDFDEPLMTARTIADSPLLRRLRLLYQMTIAKPARVRARSSPERAAFFASEAERIIRFGEENGVPVVLAFLHSRVHLALERYASSYETLAATPRFEGAAASFPRFIDVEPLIDDDPKADDHLTEISYRKMAKLFCRVLSGAAGSGCVPGSWSPRMAGVRGSEADGQDS